MVGARAPGGWRLDAVSIAGIAVFSALATLLAAVSQVLGLNFPIVPYLQFDFGEIAIFIAFFIFGPVPALVSSCVEAVALEAFGQNLPYGPVLKLFALVSSIAGLWLGTVIAARTSNPGLGKAMGWGAVVGSAVRAAVLTIPNYYLLIFVFGLSPIVGYVKGGFALVGINLTDGNALALILTFTAIFNVMQLAFASVLAYSVLRVPLFSNMKVGGRPPWFASVRSRVAPENTKG